MHPGCVKQTPNYPSELSHCCVTQASNELSSPLLLLSELFQLFSQRCFTPPARNKLALCSSNTTTSCIAQMVLTPAFLRLISPGRREDLSKMAAPNDMQQVALLLHQASSGADQQTSRAAQNQLEQIQQSPGFSSTLLVSTKYQQK